jgi:hypothetical protein
MASFQKNRNSKVFGGNEQLQRLQRSRSPKPQKSGLLVGKEPTPNKDKIKQEKKNTEKQTKSGLSNIFWIFYFFYFFLGFVEFSNNDNGYLSTAQCTSQGKGRGKETCRPQMP